MIDVMEPAPLSDPKLWISVLAFLVSAWSAFNSSRSRRLAVRALSISESQEQRRQPQLGIYMADGYRRYLPDKQLFKAVCRIPHAPALAEVAANGRGPANVFSLPARIDAHQTVAGWLVFSLDERVIAGRTIDAHRIILEDSHGAYTETEPILVRDWNG
jgi:hypothetical protein